VHPHLLRGADPAIPTERASPEIERGPLSLDSVTRRSRIRVTTLERFGKRVPKPSNRTVVFRYVCSADALSVGQSLAGRGQEHYETTVGEKTPAVDAGRADFGPRSLTCLPVVDRSSLQWRGSRFDNRSLGVSPAYCRPSRCRESGTMMRGSVSFLGRQCQSLRTSEFRKRLLHLLAVLPKRTSFHPVLCKRGEGAQARQEW
jgi:hypothetical protein